MKKYKNYNGITLIALIITIILLIILAGISISTLTNQGLLKNAKKAKEKYQESEINEKITTMYWSLHRDCIGRLFNKGRSEVKIWCVAA